MGEGRQKMVKIIKEKLERRVNQRIREELKKNRKISQRRRIWKDEEEKYLEELQSLVNSANQELESIYNQKKEKIF